MSSQLLSITQLRDDLSYDGESGLFVWLRAPLRGRNVLGMVAGTHNGNGYTYIRIRPFGNFLAHRLAWFYVHSVWPKYDIDHINGIKNDNRIENLRDVHHRENMQNQRGSKTSGKLLGAFKSEHGYVSRINVNGRLKYLGTFQTETEAHHTYLVAKRQLHPGCTI